MFSGSANRAEKNQQKRTNRECDIRQRERIPIKGVPNRECQQTGERADGKVG